jgi:hypothetical protein
VDLREKGYRCTEVAAVLVVIRKESIEKFVLFRTKAYKYLESNNE